MVLFPVIAYCGLWPRVLGCSSSGRLYILSSFAFVFVSRVFSLLLVVVSPSICWAASKNVPVRTLGDIISLALTSVCPSFLFAIPAPSVYKVSPFLSSVVFSASYPGRNVPVVKVSYPYRVMSVPFGLGSCVFPLVSWPPPQWFSVLRVRSLFFLTSFVTAMMSLWLSRSLFRDPRSKCIPPLPGCGLPLQCQGSFKLLRLSALLGLLAR